MAFQIKMNALSIVFLIGSLAFYGVVESTLDTTVKTIGCDGASFSQTDLFATNLAFVLRDIIKVTPNTAWFEYFNRSPYATSVIFGHGICNTALAAADCRKCLQNAAKIFLEPGSCTGVLNAQVVLGDCKIEHQTGHFPEHPLV